MIKFILTISAKIQNKCINVVLKMML